MNFSFNFNFLRDVRGERKDLFKDEMNKNPEEIGNPKSEEKVSFSGSELSHKEYNDIFDGDSWSIPTGNGEISASFRPLEFQSNDDSDGKMVSKAKEGWFGTRFLAKRSHSHLVTGDGNDSVRVKGNTQRNISVIEAGSGQKSIVQDLGIDDDKSVLYLDDTKGTIIVNGGDGEDELHIHHRNEGLRYQLIQDPTEVPDPDKDFNGLRIVTQGIENIYQYRDYAET